MCRLQAIVCVEYRLLYVQTTGYCMCRVEAIVCVDYIFGITI